MAEWTIPEDLLQASAISKQDRAISTPSWQRARDLGCSAVLAGEMCVVVIGLPGTGKTMLVDTVARVLRSTGWTVVTSVARLPSEAEFAALTGSAAILIDDADQLTPAELRTLNRLRQCSVLLAGALGLEKRCPADSRVNLMPLTVDEVEIFVASWLEQAGLQPGLIADAAIAHLAVVSAGIPRALRTLMTDALKGARADGSDQIDKHHIDNAAWFQVARTAARRLDRAAPPPQPGTKKPQMSRPDVELEKRLLQAPFADARKTDRPASLRALWLLCPAVALVGTGYVLAFLDWPLRVSIDIPALEVVTAVKLASEPPAQPLAEVPPTAPADSIPQIAPEATEIGPASGEASIATQPEPPPHFSEHLAPEVIRLLNQRGQQMIDLNDLSAARLLFSRAAEAGSIKAMLAMGRSYDPTIAGNPAPRPGSDPAQAADWYRKAAALGSSDAAIFLQQLERRTRD